jgi:non-specific serine/threonine protein kinase
LALELAAARVAVLSVEQIVPLLDQRFRLLTSGSRTELPRHQTLRASIDWSYDLLNEVEKHLFARLAVFAGGWTRAAAEIVGVGEPIAKDDVLYVLLGLIEKSLVVADEAGDRYRMLETIRQYAGEKLAETNGTAAVCERHRDFYLALVEEAEPKLTGAEQGTWLQRLDVEHENLRAGLEWSFAETESRGGLRLCGALTRFWMVRGHPAEGREWCTRFLDKEGGKERTKERAKVLHAAGTLAYIQGDYSAAWSLLEQSLATRRQLGDRKGIAHTLNNLGILTRQQGDFAAARALHDESLVIRRELDDRLGVAHSLNNLGLVAYYQGDYPAARTLLEECLAISPELGDRNVLAYALNNLGLVAYYQGDYRAARAFFEECLALTRELRDRFGIAFSLEGQAAVIAALGDSPRAARIWGAAERLREEIGSPVPPNEKPRHDGRVATARAGLGDDAAFDDAWHEGRALALEGAIELALEKTVRHP